MLLTIPAGQDAVFMPSAGLWYAKATTVAEGFTIEKKSSDKGQSESVGELW
jgi:hypothetical protein